MCSDTPPQEKKYIFQKEPSSPSTSLSPPRNTSPNRVWQDKHVVSEHASTSERQRKYSHSPPHELATEQVEQQEQVNDSHNIQITQPITSPQPSSPSSSHGSLVQKDIRKRLRSSRRPRSPEENDKSRKVEIESKIHSNRRQKKGGNRKRLF